MIYHIHVESSNIQRRVYYLYCYLDTGAAGQVGEVGHLLDPLLSSVPQSPRPPSPGKSKIKTWAKIGNDKKKEMTTQK